MMISYFLRLIDKVISHTLHTSLDPSRQYPPADQLTNHSLTSHELTNCIQSILLTAFLRKHYRIASSYEWVTRRKRFFFFTGWAWDYVVETLYIYIYFSFFFYLYSFLNVSSLSLYYRSPFRVSPSNVCHAQDNISVACPCLLALHFQPWGGGFPTLVKAKWCNGQTLGVSISKRSNALANIDIWRSYKNWKCDGIYTDSCPRRWANYDKKVVWKFVPLWGYF